MSTPDPRARITAEGELRVWRRANALLGLTASIMVLTVGWGGVRLFVCWDSRLNWYQEFLCEISWAPAVLAWMLGMTVMWLLVQDLRVRGGYRQLDPASRRRVTWSVMVFSVVAVTFGMLLCLVPLGLM